MNRNWTKSAMSLLSPKLALTGLLTGLVVVAAGCVGTLDTGPTSTMARLQVSPLPIPDGTSLPVAKRAARLNLSLTVLNPQGTYHQRYGLDMGSAYAAGLANQMGDAYRQSVSDRLPQELMAYLSRAGIFKRVERREVYQDIESDLVLTVELSRFELREKSLMEIFVSGLGGGHTKTTRTTEGDLQANLKLVTRGDGKTIFELLVTQKAPPKTQVTDEPILGRSRQPTSPEQTRKHTEEYEALVNAMFEQLHAKLVEKDTELILAALSGPELPRVAESKPLGPIKQRYAVIIGVSRYKNTGGVMKNLKYADRDARGLAEFLLSPAAGGFQPDAVRLLINEEATCKNIRAALFEFLREANNEDVVIIDFAGHGMPDPQKPNQVSLACYDTDPAHLPSTGLPMTDVREALERHIESQRVVVLADACHSAGAASKGTRDANRAIGVVSAEWARLTDVRPTSAIFTSSEGYEPSHEGEQWGGGHGVFTWALLEGLKGKADGQGGELPDGKVTLGELVEFVRAVVIKETSKAQHPFIAGTYDRNLPLGLVGVPKP